MPRLRWAAVLVAFTFLCGALAAPATAQTRRERDAASAKRAKLAAELNTLRASDAQIESALRTLNSEVDAQLAKAASARQAVQAAERRVAQANAEVAATEQRIAGLRKVVVDRAVDAYIRPNTDNGLSDVANPSEAARRDALLAQVVARDRDLVDQLGAALEDLELKRAAATSAKEVAVTRRKAVDARAVELLRIRSARQKVASDLDKRIASLAAEADAAAAHESAITRIIAEREAQRASRGGFGPTAVSGAGLIWPVRGPITSEYGPRWGRQHTGIDIGAGTGTPIRAAKAGEVVFAGRMGGYGNCIIVNHGGGFSTLYAHQSRLGASDGQDVEQGEVIGYVGSTGNSTGPHLHFETRVNGNPQNPRRYLP